MDHSLNSPGDAITLVTHFEDRHELPIFLAQNQAADSELASSPIVIDKKGYCISVQLNFHENFGASGEINICLFLVILVFRIFVNPAITTVQNRSRTPNVFLLFMSELINYS